MAFPSTAAVATEKVGRNPSCRVVWGRQRCKEELLGATALQRLDTAGNSYWILVQNPFHEMWVVAATVWHGHNKEKPRAETAA